MTGDPARRAREHDRRPLAPQERADLRVTLAALAADPHAAAELVHGSTGAAPGPLSELVRTVARDAVARLAAAELPVELPEVAIPEPRTAPETSAHPPAVAPHG